MSIATWDKTDAAMYEDPSAREPEPPLLFWFAVIGLAWVWLCDRLFTDTERRLRYLEGEE